MLDHYEIARTTLTSIRKRWVERGTVQSAFRSGRPEEFEATAREQLRVEQRRNRRATPHQLYPLVVGASGGGMYRGNEKDHFSERTIYRQQKKEGYLGKGTKLRPKISHSVASERVAYAQYLIRNKDKEHTRVKIDEKYFVLPGMFGKSEDDERFPEGHKKHPPQIMVIAGVSKPVLKRNLPGRRKTICGRKMGRFLLRGASGCCHRQPRGAKSYAAKMARSFVDHQGPEVDWEKKSTSSRQAR